MSGLLLTVLMLGLPHACDLLWGNGPMVLHGKVVDQQGNPLPGLPVVFTASAWTRLQVPVAGARETLWVIRETTDQHGTFVIDAGWGRALFPGTTGDLGRLNADVPGPFHYGRAAPAHEDHGSVARPVVFMSWNDALKRIISRDVVARIGPGWHTFTYRSGRVSPYGRGGENLEFRIVGPTDGLGGPRQWIMEVEGIHGDIRGAEGRLEGIAPDGGYANTPLRFAAKSDGRAPPSQITARFYEKGTDLLGLSPLYSRVEIVASLNPNNETGTVTIRYAANFSGSRDLVPGPVNAAGRK